MGIIAKIWGNITKRGLKDVTDPKRIKNFLDGEVIDEYGLHLEKDQIIPYAKQLVERINTPACKQCLIEGKCIHCGCSMPTAILTPDWECSEGHFSKMVLPKRSE